LDGAVVKFGTNEIVHDYIQRTGHMPNRMVVRGRLVRYRGRAPWLAAYWQSRYALSVRAAAEARRPWTADETELARAQIAAVRRAGVIVPGWLDDEVTRYAPKG
jgi:hypothetical protein